MRVIIDNREQTPFWFNREFYQSRGVTSEQGTLQIGDYSLAGLTDRVAIERKSLPDLVQCLGRERQRFERELIRARGLDVFAVVIEDTFESLGHGEYKSKLKPHSACQSVMSFTVKYGIPFLFAGSRLAAEYCTWSLLHQYLDGAQKRYKAIVKAHGIALGGVENQQQAIGAACV